MRLSFALAFQICLLIFMLPGAAVAEKLTIFNRENYLADAVIERWEQQTGIGIERVMFDRESQRDQILANAERSNIDIILVDEVAARIFGRKGKLQPINAAAVANLQNNDAVWQQRCGDYAMPYFWGTFGILYRTDKVTRPPHSWRDLLSPQEELRGHIGMQDNAIDLLAPALLLQNAPINTDDRAVLRNGFDMLRNQVPHVLTFEYPATFVQAAARADELYMAMGFGGDQAILNKVTGRPGLWRYVVPEEGSILWVECLAVMAGSPRQALAYRFLQFLNEPEIAALNAETVYMATPNAAALAHLSPAFRQDRQVFPGEEVLERSQSYEILGVENIQLRERISAAIIKLHETQ